jgi:flagellar FliJ protein
MSTGSMEMLLALLQQAQSQRDEALAARQRALDAERRAEAQAAQLLAYRQDYERRWRAQMADGQGMAVVGCYQSFGERLTQAIEQQRRQVEALRAQRERIEAALLERERMLASTAKLLERRRADDARVAARHERRLDDESAARAALLRMRAELGAAA